MATNPLTLSGGQPCCNKNCLSLYCQLSNDGRAASRSLLSYIDGHARLVNTRCQTGSAKWRSWRSWELINVCSTPTWNDKPVSTALAHGQKSSYPYVPRCHPQSEILQPGWPADVAVQKECLGYPVIKHREQLLNINYYGQTCHIPGNRRETITEYLNEWNIRLVCIFDR